MKFEKIKGQVKKLDVEEVVGEFQRMQQQEPRVYQQTIADLRSVILAGDEIEEGDFHDEILSAYSGWDQRDVEKLLQTLGETYELPKKKETSAEEREDITRREKNAQAKKEFELQERVRVQAEMQRSQRELVDVQAELSALQNVTDDTMREMAGKKREQRRAGCVKKLEAAQKSYQDYLDNHYKPLSLWAKFRDREGIKEIRTQREEAIKDAEESIRELDVPTWETQEISVMKQTQAEKEKVLTQKINNLKRNLDQLASRG